MAAPASLLLPPTSGNSASHQHNTPYQHFPPLRSPWMPDLLQGLDLVSHQQRTVMAQGSACNSAPPPYGGGHCGASGPGLSAVSPVFLAPRNPPCSGRQSVALVPRQLRELSQFPLPAFPCAPPVPPGRALVSPPAVQWQSAGESPSLLPPKTMSETFARWGGMGQSLGGSRGFVVQEELAGGLFGQGSAFSTSTSMLLPGMNGSKAISQVDHEPGVQLPLDGGFSNQCRSDFFQSSHVLGTSNRLPEVSRGMSIERRDDVGSDILNPCSPSRWENAMSTSSHWPLNVPDLSLDDSGEMHGQSLVVGNATEDLQLGDFCFHQWPMLEVQEANGNHDCGGGSIASELGASGHCKEGSLLCAASGHFSPLDGTGSPVTVLESCLLMESQSRSQSIADLCQLCPTGGDSGKSSVHFASPVPSACEEHIDEHGSSEDDNVQGLQQQHHANSCVKGMLPATVGSKRARIPDCALPALEAGEREVGGDSPCSTKASTAVAKKRRRVSPVIPSPKDPRKGSAAASGILPGATTEWRKEASSDSATGVWMQTLAATATDSGASSAAKKRRGVQAVELSEVQARQPGASRSNQKISKQVSRASAGVADLSGPASLEVKPGAPGNNNKRKRGGRGGGTTAPQPAKRTRNSKLSQASSAGGGGEAVAVPPSDPKGSPSSERESHVIAERRRRKSMNCMLTTLGSLLPADGVHPKPSDRLKIVAETITYIESLQQSLKHLGRKKTELAVAEKLLTGSHNLFAGSKSSRIYPSNAVDKWSWCSGAVSGGWDEEAGKAVAKQEAAVPSFTPMFTLDISGAEAFITLTCLKGSLQLFSKTLLLLEGLRFRILNAQKSSNNRTAYHMIHITDAGETRMKKEELEAALQNLANTFQ